MKTPYYVFGVIREKGKYILKGPLEQEQLLKKNYVVQ